MTSTMKSKLTQPRKDKPGQSLDPTAYTPEYSYRPVGAHSSEQELHCEGVSLEDIAKALGTPAYVYSQKSIQNAYRKLDAALGSLPHALCYAVKANANLSVLRVLKNLGAGFDIVSGGELDRLRRIGVSGNRIVFSGVGKSREEIREALAYPGKQNSRCGIFLFNVESEAELDVFLSESFRHIAAGGTPPSAAIRVNPDVVAGGHRHISTGTHQHKFGVDWPEARRLYLLHKNSRWFAWRGISMHIGSQILSLGPYLRAVRRLASYVRELARNGIRLDTIDCGGGLGIRYTTEAPPAVNAYARTLAGIVKPLGCRLLLEPGRTLVGPAGVLLTRVFYTKETQRKTFVVVDAAMNDLIRPVLYEATHPITKVRSSNRTPERKIVDIVGPVCETGDFLARDRLLDLVKPGDLLAVWAAGAYGFVESSNYNGRPRAAEVMVAGRRFRVIRRRESRNDLVRGES
jgi:diaminopimelate decarboxylase